MNPCATVSCVVDVIILLAPWVEDVATLTVRHGDEESQTKITFEPFESN